jgi:outer membrane protein assembly factor BamB
MNSNRTIHLSLLLLGFVGFIFIFWWLFNVPSSNFTVHTEGADNRGGADSAQDVTIGEIFFQYSTQYSELSETWPRFRGADFDNISKSPVKLIEKFGAEGPKIIWSIELGEGHSGAAIYNGLAYVLDYDEETRADMLRCFSLVDGKEQWRAAID